MNQILSVEMPNNTRGRKRSSIDSIVRVFAVILILFGIGMSTTGAYSYYKNSKTGNNNQIAVNSNSKPLITIEGGNSPTKKIVVTHDKEIQEVTYTLNGEEQTVPGNNQTELEIEIELPTGSSTLNIIAKDTKGSSSSYETSYEIGPLIQLDRIENQVQLTVTSTINIDYVSYYWDEDKENAKNFTINDLKTKTLIDVIEGDHTLNIEVADIEGHKATKTQKIIADTKPELKITSNGKQFKIVAKDDEELTKFEMKLNSNDVITKEISTTEHTEIIDLEEGENKLMVRVYNKNGIAATAKVKNTKE